MTAVNPRHEVGDLVRFGSGIVPYEVVAVILTGRYPHYDLVCKGRLSMGMRRQGVDEIKLRPYPWEL